MGMRQNVAAARLMINETVSIGTDLMRAVHETRGSAEEPRHIPQRAVVSGVLYDLANTIFSMGVVSMYFSMWVRDQIGADRADFVPARSPLRRWVSSSSGWQRSHSAAAS
jgi:MFS-type transporter involved in bile tolerance (Atg22 family)